MCYHDKSTKLVFKAPKVQGQQFEVFVCTALKYYLVPHEEKWYAHLRSDVIKLEIISITKPHTHTHDRILSYMRFQPRLLKVSPS